ncbi:MAG: FAD-binding oxidoreductase [Muribaculaceae bacterium]|nr:FAD-binding oxidoreductase [Muribaculaceae bacterium]
MEPKYQEYVNRIGKFIPADRIYTDDLRRIAWGADAGFYHLVPQVVVRSASEKEVAQLLYVASQMSLPVTFRAAGTSLSGQAISDSILIVAGKNWEKYSIAPDHLTITMQPGIIGSRVCEILAPLGRTFSPDPASKNSAMVGGIVCNNASGMNCGTHANSDKVLVSVRMVLADGSILDTGDEQSREMFRQTHPQVISGIEALRDEILADPELVELIRYKYSIKNVTGLNIRPFIDYTDPFEIMAHCLVGSEGTLAFLSEITANTAHLYPHSASAMLYFNSPREACEAVLAMKKGPVFSAEMLDSKSLAAVNDTTGDNLTAILTETKADSKEELQRNIDAIMEIIKPFKLAVPARFTDDPAEFGEYWRLRSGVFPAVGGTRPLGTTVLIEDIAFHIEDLPDATEDLLKLLKESGYPDACIYGHVLEGNYHFIISQRFDSEEEVDRYRHLMEEVEKLVVDKYHGSLKAEHGTGRNMAPFVKKEWGDKAWSVMRRLKDIFDPKGMLNPGVIFNDDPLCYVKNIKSMPLTNKWVNRCIECGFCEVNCVSCGFTLSARQRIVVQREIERLKITGENPVLRRNLIGEFKYLGNQTCAGDGLCSTSCPMKINTGEMIHDLRADALPPGSLGYKVGKIAADHLNLIEDVMRPALSVASGIRAVIGDENVNSIGKALNEIGAPLWTSTLPGAFYGGYIAQSYPADERKVVYFPSCINRTMGASHEPGGTPPDLVNVFVKLCNRAGYEVIFPASMSNLCCGMIWESKGMPDLAEEKINTLEQALWQASEQGKYPVVCDQSPCLHRMRDHIKSMRLFEPAEFISDFLSQHLQFQRLDRRVAVHVTCSSRLMGLGPKIIDLARRCATTVFVPAEIGCCGFAGDKGFTLPALNRYALRKLRPQIQENNIHEGYSNSRTCEIGLSTNSGIPYKSIVYLVEEATRTKE